VTASLPRADPQPLTGKALIVGCAGTRLTDDERGFLAAERPWGLILFKRNCRTKDQIRDLVDEFRDIVGRPEAPVLIDQEGGRVQRLGPPGWRSYPPGRVLGRLAQNDIESGLRAAWLHGRLIAADLDEIGISVDCLPVLDVSQANVSRVIGDRSFGSEPELVADIGRFVCNGLLDGGILPVLKHIPGHGRATVDSHVTLPVVAAALGDLETSDFVPFAALADMPMAMTGHVVYSAIDCDFPATTSPTVIRSIIRQRIGFDGLLMSDDISMGALSGDYPTRAKATYAAGCDLVLHCNGRMDEMRDVALVAPPLEGIAAERAVRALSRRHRPKPFDRETGRAELLSLAARAGWRRRR
jgi:beta-N-acetylhexosaminidase